MHYLDRIVREMDQIFEESLDKSTLGRLPEAYWQPALDIYELAASLLVVVELPGVEKKAVKVTVADDVLTISGVRYNMVVNLKHICHRIEIQQGRFSRSIRLNVPVKRDAIEAKLENGFLKIQIPKEL
jgi:HSP20 family protein